MGYVIHREALTSVFAFQFCSSDWSLWLSPSWSAGSGCASTSVGSPRKFVKVEALTSSEHLTRWVLTIFLIVSSSQYDQHLLIFLQVWHVMIFLGMFYWYHSESQRTFNAFLSESCTFPSENESPSEINPATDADTNSANDYRQEMWVQPIFLIVPIQM